MAWTVQRAPLVEPVHARGVEPRVAPVWPASQGLALASASQVYPRLLNGDSVIDMAEQSLPRLGRPRASVGANTAGEPQWPRRRRHLEGRLSGRSASSTR